MTGDEFWDRASHGAESLREGGGGPGLVDEADDADALDEEVEDLY